MDMTAEEKSDIIKKVVERVRGKGIVTRGNYITIEEMLISPEVARVLWSDEPVCNVCGSKEKRTLATAYEACPDHGMHWDVNTPEWRYRQHQLLDFMQSYNTDEMLRYVASYL